VDFDFPFLFDAPSVLMLSSPLPDSASCVAFVAVGCLIAEVSFCVLRLVVIRLDFLFSISSLVRSAFLNSSTMLVFPPLCAN